MLSYLVQRERLKHTENTKNPQKTTDLFVAGSDALSDLLSSQFCIPDAQTPAADFGSTYPARDTQKNKKMIASSWKPDRSKLFSQGPAEIWQNCSVSPGRNGIKSIFYLSTSGSEWATQAALGQSNSHNWLRACDLFNTTFSASDGSITFSKSVYQKASR